MTSEYWNRVPEGTRTLDRSLAERWVLEPRLDLLTETHQLRDRNVCTALEYSVSLGKHAVTEHLLKLGVPITRTAIMNAAKRKGPGVDMLLAATKEEHFENTRSAAVTFRLTYGDFEKAYDLLDAGAKPERYFVSGAHSGALRREDMTLFHEALDRMLRCISKDELAESTLFLLVENGRPIHIERALEILEKPVSWLLPRVFASGAAVERLREFSLRVDPASFELFSKDLPYDARHNPLRYIRQVCKVALEDGCEGLIPASNVQGMLADYIKTHALFIAGGLRDGSGISHEMAEIFSTITRCVIPEERANLHSVIERWNEGRRTLLLSERAISDLRSILDEAIGRQTEASVEYAP